MTSTPPEVRTLLESWSQAVQTKDIEHLMSLYSPDITYFDVVPPLQYVGTEALRRNFLRWFGSWESGIGVEIRNLTIVASGTYRDGTSASPNKRNAEEWTPGQLLGPRDDLLPTDK